MVIVFTEPLLIVAVAVAPEPMVNVTSLGDDKEIAGTDWRLMQVSKLIGLESVRVTPFVVAPTMLCIAMGFVLFFASSAL